MTTDRRRTARAVLALATILAITSAGCSRDESAPTRCLRLVDVAERVTIESAIAMPDSLAGFHDGATELAAGTVAALAAATGGTIPDASFVAGLPFVESGFERAAAPTLTFLAASDPSLRARHVIVDWTRELAAGEGLYLLALHERLDSGSLRAKAAFESFLRGHAAFVRRLEPETRGAGEFAFSAIHSPEKPGETTLLFAISRGAPPERAAARVVALAPGLDWLLATADPDPARAAIRNVAIGSITRDAFVLGDSGRVSLELELPREAPRLRFHVAARGLESARRVAGTIAFAAADGARVEFPLAATLDPRRWHDVELPLEEVAGRAGTLSIDLKGERLPRDACLLLGEPIVDASADGGGFDILLISLDTTRADRMSLYGHSRKTTPHLDRLAESAAVFEHAIAPAPWTLPSHASVFSGCHPDRHGAVGPASRIPARLPWLPSIARDRGFETHAVTGGGYVNPEFGFARGFEEYVVADPAYPSLEWATAAGNAASIELARRALDARRDLLERFAAPRRRPLFSFVHTYASHNYGAPPSATQGLGADAATAKRLVRLDPTKRSWDLTAPADEATRRELEDARLVYDGAVVTADAFVGELIAGLEASGRLERTIVVVFSDHGEELGEREGFGHGQSVFEEQVRVPLLIRVPGLAARRVTEPVSLVDLAPTLCELLGWERIEGDGRSLAPLLRGGRVEPRPVLSRGNRRDTVFRGMRGRREKLIETTIPGVGSRRALFDLAADPGETRDLADTRAADRDKLATLLATVVADLRAKGSGTEDVAISADLEAQLRQLGYLGGR